MLHNILRKYLKYNLYKQWMGCVLERKIKQKYIHVDQT